MSGGSLNYAYQKLNDAIEMINDRVGDDALVLAFSSHLEAVSDALKDLEWWWSCDRSREDFEVSARKVIPPNGELNAAVKRAESSLKMLQSVLEKDGT